MYVCDFVRSVEHVVHAFVTRMDAAGYVILCFFHNRTLMRSVVESGECIYIGMSHQRRGPLGQEGSALAFGPCDGVFERNC